MMITTIKNMITGLFPDVWPVTIIITVIACSLRIAYLVKYNQKFCFYKKLFMLLFIIYVMCLFEAVTVQDQNYGLSNFIPSIKNNIKVIVPHMVVIIFNILINF